MSDHLLLLDDDRLFCEQLARRLEKAGFSVHSYHSAEAFRDALDALPTLHSAVVDMRIGEDNGLDLIAPLRTAQPRARIIMLTGYGSIPTAVEATRRGADDYLLKPVDLNDLLVKLRPAESASSETPALPDAPPSLARLEWDYIQRILLENDGNVSATARQLGIDRRTLQRRLQKRPAASDYNRDRDAER